MRQIALKIFLILILVTIIAEFLNKDPGYVLIEYQSWAIESSLSVFGFLLLGLLILVLTLWQLIKPILLSRGWLHKKRLKNLDEERAKGWLWLAEGEHQKAEEALLEFAEKTGAPTAYFLGAAQAAEARGEKEKRSEYLNLAAQHCKKESQKIAVGLTQAQLQFSAKEWEPCLATLLSIASKAPKHKAILKLLARTYFKLEDWPKLKEMLPKLKKYDVITNKDFENLTKRTYLGLLSKLSSIKEPGEQVLALTNLWKSIPAKHKSDADINKLYIKSLITFKREDLASKEIEKAIDTACSDELFTLYSQLAPHDLSEKWEKLNEWLNISPSNATLHLALGRVALHRKDWDKAQAHFKKSLKLKPSSDGYFELARLSANLGDNKTSTELQEKGLSLLNAKLPSLPQPGLS